MGCSQLQARVIFFRAKTSLRKQLTSRGVGATQWLAVMAIFGRMTTSARALSFPGLTAANTQVGLGAATIGILGANATIFATLFLTAALGLGGLLLYTSSRIPSRDQV